MSRCWRASTRLPNASRGGPAARCPPRSASRSTRAFAERLIPAEWRRGHPFGRYFDSVEAQLHFDLFALVPAGFELQSLYEERSGLRDILAAASA